MSSEPLRFHESNLWSTPIRDLGLTIEGTRLEPILAEFEDDLHQAGSPAYSKLSYCSRMMATLRDRNPEVTNSELDEDVGDIEYSLDQYYGRATASQGEVPPGVDGALKTFPTFPTFPTSLPISL